MAESKSKKGSFASDLQALLESGEGADVTLVVGDSRLPAHSQILAARSPVFAAMLRTNMQEASSRCIEITDVQEDVLRQMLWFIYTDTAPQLDTVAAGLLAAADKYDLPLLKQECEKQMLKDVSVENAAATAALAVLHCCPELGSTAVEFIARHPEVMATAGWERLLRDSAGAAVEVCKQLAAAPTRPAPQPAPSQTDVKKTSDGPQSSESRTVPQEIKQKMAAKLIDAATNGRTREVWALLTAGAEKNVRDVNGNTALHLAVAKGHASTVKCLLDGGLDVNAVNSSRQTPLHVAAQKRDTDITDITNIIWMLVAASARVDVQDSQGQTPLHLAARKEDQYSISVNANEHVVKVLLLAGARRDIKNCSGSTPESLAKEYMKRTFITYTDLL